MEISKTLTVGETVATLRMAPMVQGRIDAVGFRKLLASLNQSHIVLVLR